MRREAQFLHRPVAAVVRLGHHRRGRRLQRRPHDRRRVHDLFGQRRRHPPGRVGQRGDPALDGIGIDLGLRGIGARPAGRRPQRRDHQPQRQAAATGCRGHGLEPTRHPQRASRRPRPHPRGQPPGHPGPPAPAAGRQATSDPPAPPHKVPRCLTTACRHVHIIVLTASRPAYPSAPPSPGL